MYMGGVGVTWFIPGSHAAGAEQAVQHPPGRAGPDTVAMVASSSLKGGGEAGKHSAPFSSRLSAAIVFRQPPPASKRGRHEREKDATWPRDRSRKGRGVEKAAAAAAITHAGQET